MLVVHQMGGRCRSPMRTSRPCPGLTTTGCYGAEPGWTRLPVSLNIWRTFLQWLGGMGILILAVAVLPLLGVGGSQLFQGRGRGAGQRRQAHAAHDRHGQGAVGRVCVVFRQLARWPSGWAA